MLISKRCISAVISILVIAASLSAHDYRLSIGGSFGYGTLNGGDLLSFDPNTSFGGRLGIRLGDRWQLDFSYDRHQFEAERDVTVSGTVDGFVLGQAADFASDRYGLTLNRWLFDHRSAVNWQIGVGGGLADWTVTEPVGDTAFLVAGDIGQTTTFTASELFLTASTGVMLFWSQLIMTSLTVNADYFTGGGVSLASTLASDRDRWQFSAQISFNLLLGRLQPTGERWRSDRAWTEQPSLPPARRVAPDRDGDADGVVDADDDCPNTRPGVRVNARGCAIDSDRDGVPDGLDDCPTTPVAARGQVDIYGCPVDRDFDAVPDYRDACPDGPIGGRVDSVGCPVDSDGDGVPDGLDDCPNTLPGIAVDPFGCYDLSIFAEPMTLNIDYESGSFEIDPHSQEKLRRLAGLLLLVPEVKLEIYGYTDNIGTETANRSLSERRARRVLDFLRNQGVEAARMTAAGRGETNFVASNDTAAGRSANRRIEIVFYRP